VQVSTTHMGVLRSMPIHMPGAATVANLKDTICENMRVLVQEQRLLAANSGDALEDPRLLWELRAQVGDPLPITLVVAPLGLLVLGGGLGASSRLCLWDMDRSEALQEFTDTADAVLCTAVDWHGQRALSGGWEVSLRLWDLAHGKTTHELAGHVECGIFCVAADWAAQRALSGGQDRTLRLWDIQTCCNIQTLIGHTHPIFCAALDWNSLRALSGSQDRCIRYWSLERGETVQVLRGHAGTVMCLAVDWQWQRVLSGSWDCTLRLWDLTCGEMLIELRGHSHAVLCVTMDCTSQRAASGSADNMICVWELAQGTCIRQLCGHVDMVTSVDADWTSQRAVSGSKDGTLRLWDLDSGDSTVLQGRLDELRCVQARWQPPQSAQSPNAASRARSKTLPR